MKKCLKDNWRLILLVFAFFVGFLAIDRLSKDSNIREDLRESDARILELEKDNRKKDKTILEAAKMARRAEEIVEAKERAIAEKDRRIEELMEKEGRIEEEVRELPSAEVVLLTAEILGCPDGVMLRGQEVVFTLECAKRNLAVLKKFPLVERQRDEALAAGLDAKEALQFQKIATWNVYRIAWAQGGQISNWEAKYEEKDRQFGLAMKEKRKAWLDGLWKGFVAGVIMTVTLKALLKK